jgi:hypothetical protein
MEAEFSCKHWKSTAVYGVTSKEIMLLKICFNYLSIHGSTVLLLDLGCFFSFLNLYRIGRTPWTGDQPVARPLPTHRTTQTENKRKQISMPSVGFAPTIPAFQRAKTVHALDRAATVIGTWLNYRAINMTMTSLG